MISDNGNAAFQGSSVMIVIELGAVLAVAGVLLLIAEAHLSTAGFVATAGTALLLAGGTFLIAGSGPSLLWAMPLVLAAVAAVGGVVLFARSKTSTLRRSRPRTGTEALVGAQGVVTDPPRPTGYARVDGGRWRIAAAEGVDEPLETGDRVVVQSVRGLMLLVRPA
jgi:membrane-bound serine protease (ClpP class)